MTALVTWRSCSCNGEEGCTGTEAWTAPPAEQPWGDPASSLCQTWLLNVPGRESITTYISLARFQSTLISLKALCLQHLGGRKVNHYLYLTDGETEARGMTVSCQRVQGVGRGQVTRALAWGSSWNPRPVCRGVGQRQGALGGSD